MRVAVILIGIVMVSTPSHASTSCMSLAEARQQFGAVHLYWHGSGHCWDAHVGRHGLVHRHDGSRQVARDDAEPKAAEKAPPRWRDARSEMLSEMLPDDAPVFRSAAPALAAAAQSDAPPPGPNWLDRWVDIIQVVPRMEAGPAAAPVAALPTKFEPLVTPVRLILAFLALILTIAVIEILFRSTIQEYRK